MAGLVLIAGLIRVRGLGDDPLWLDEAWSLWFAQKSWPYLWSVVPTYEIHPPTFYSLLKLWTAFGTGEFALRTLPAFFGTVTVGIAFAICRLALPVRHALIAATGAGLFVAAHPLHVHYSQEVREYSMYALAFSVMLAGSVWLASNVRRAGLPWWGVGQADGGRRTVLAWIAVTAGGALCLWSNNTGVLFVASCGLALAVALLVALRRRETPVWAVYNGLLAAGLILVIWAPWLPHLLGQVNFVPDDFWIQVDRYRIYRTMGDFLSFSFPGSTRRDVIFAFGILPATLTVLGTVYLIRNAAYAGYLLLACLILPPLLNLAASLIAQPILVTKVLLPSLVPFSVLVGFGTQAVWHFARPAGIAVMLAMLALLSFGSWKYLATSEAPEPWRDVAALISASYQDGDVVLTIPNFVAMPLRYYLHDTAETRYPVHGLPKPYPEINAIDRQTFRDLDLEPWFDEWRGVWLVTRGDPDIARDKATLESADTLGTRVLEKQYGYLVTVYYFRANGQRVPDGSR